MLTGASVLGAAVAGLLVGLGAAPVVRRLPPPHDAAADIYRTIAVSRMFGLAVGLAAAFAVLFVVTSVGAWPARLPWLVLATIGVLLVCVDTCTQYLPRRGTTMALAVLGAALLVMPALGAGWATVGRAALAGLLSAGFFAVLWLVSRGAVGFGDVRFAPLVGASAGAVSWPLLGAALLLGSVGAVVFGLLYVAVTRRRTFPYTPGLVLGAFVALAVFG